MGTARSQLRKRNQKQMEKTAHIGNENSPAATHLQLNTQKMQWKAEFPASAVSRLGSGTVRIAQTYSRKTVHFLEEETQSSKVLENCTQAIAIAITRMRHASGDS